MYIIMTHKLILEMYSINCLI